MSGRTKPQYYILRYLHPGREVLEPDPPVIEEGELFSLVIAHRIAGHDTSWAICHKRFAARDAPQVSCVIAINISLLRMLHRKGTTKDEANAGDPIIHHPSARAKRVLHASRARTLGRCGPLPPALLFFFFSPDVPLFSPTIIPVCAPEGGLGRAGPPGANRS